MNYMELHLDKWIEVNGAPKPYEPHPWYEPPVRLNRVKLFFDTTSTSYLKRLMRSHSEHAELWIKRDGNTLCFVTNKQVRKELQRRENIRAQRKWKALATKPLPPAIPKTLEVARIMKLLSGFSAKQLVNLL